MKRLAFFALTFLLATITSVTVVHGESQTVSTDGGSLEVMLTHDTIKVAGNQVGIGIDFINPPTQTIQEHIDYTVTVTKEGTAVFGPIPPTHTTPGSVTIPVQFNQGDGIYKMDVTVDGILFTRIPEEMASFEILVGMKVSNGEDTHKVNDTQIKVNEKELGDDIPDNGGECMIATAAYGSEIAPQVQQLRELRDNTILTTKTGATFMLWVNQIYYSFSPAIADIQRENPIFKETIKITLIPLITTLPLLEYTDIDSEFEMLVYGIPIILLNVGVYIVAPVLVTLWGVRHVKKAFAHKPEQRNL